MTDTPEWKKALQEPHALGWIGFFILVIVIGFAALHFDFGDVSHHDAKPAVSHAAR
jgi:hypothetical protein